MMMMTLSHASRYVSRHRMNGYSWALSSPLQDANTLADLNITVFKIFEHMQDANTHADLTIIVTIVIILGII